MSFLDVKTQRATLTLAVVCGLAAMSLPAVSQAGNVGYFTCSFDPVGIPAAITAAGHTPVAVNSLDAASLAPLNGLVIACQSYTANPAVNNAVSNGMALFVEDRFVPSGIGASLPGSPALVVNTYTTSGSTYCPTNADLASGSPIASGPGGALTDSSLDHGSACSPMGYATSASLPAGAVPLLTTGNANEVGAFGYTYGSGRVVFSISQYIYGNAYFPGAGTYFTNTIAWLVAGGWGSTTTCASEGYTGLKLDWCRNICEKDYTGTQLKTWIRRWMDRYHDLPYCMREDEETPPQEQGKF